MVVNQDIVSGLRAALERGQSLRSAMISFFNAGYPREEIEDAARALIEFGTNPNAEPTQVTPSVSNQIQPVRTQPAQPKPQKPQPQSQPAPKVPQVQQPMQNIPSVRPVQPSPLQKMKEEAKAKPAQKISGYGTPRKRKGSLTIIILILLLVIFVGLLISIFLFKQQLIDWLSTMF